MGTINQQYEQHYEDNELPLGPSMYPWSRDNPYLHTSAQPYIISRQRPVRPDEQYPPSLQYQYSYYAPPTFSSLSPYYSDLPTLYPSNIDHGTLYPSNIDHGTLYPSNIDHGTLYPTSIDHHNTDSPSAFQVPGNVQIVEKEIREITKANNDRKPINQIANLQPSSEDKALSEGEIINENDSTKEILSKLQGEGVHEDGEDEGDKESEGISEELENAFQNLSLTNNSWDEGTQI